MGRVILFSPVGLTDPISRDPYYDGAMMHIYRHRNIDYTYLYMTEDIYQIEFHKENGIENDHRYTKALDMLARDLVSEGKLSSEKAFRCKALSGKDHAYKILRSQVKKNNVHKMDAFYYDYRRCIELIQKEQNFGSKDTLLINISSGTPAMKAALYILKSMLSIPCELIQVTDPKPRSFKYPKYSLDMQYNINKDKDPSAKNRIQIAKCDNLVMLKMCEIVKNLVDRHDYSGAEQVVSNLSFANPANKQIGDKLIRLLQVAASRKMLLLSDSDIKWLIKFQNNLPEEQRFFPYSSGCKCDDMTFLCQESFLQLELFYDKEEYTQFVRAMTPLNTELMSMIFYAKTNQDIKDVVDNLGRFVESLDKKQEGQFSELAKHWDSDFSRKVLTPGRIVTALSYEVIGFFGSSDYMLMKELATIEHCTRDKVAHYIIPLSRKELMSLTRFSPKMYRSIYGKAPSGSIKGFDAGEILKKERALIEMVGLPIHLLDDSYTKMNSCIKDIIDRLQ